MFFMDWQHLIYVALPMMALCGLASLWVKMAYSKYARIPSSQGISGADAARVILRKAEIYDVKVEEVAGFLSDHYSPREKTLRLSPENYRGTSIAAVGIAAHEAGHAIQHARRFAPLAIRALAVPMASLGSSLGYIVIFIGMFMMGANLNPLTMAGLILIGGVAFFQLINLPVEFDASRRALKLLPEIGILTKEENAGARKMLTAAAFTYVAATIAAVVELLFWMARLGLLGGSSDD